MCRFNINDDEKLNSAVITSGHHTSDVVMPTVQLGWTLWLYFMGIISRELVNVNRTERAVLQFDLPSEAIVLWDNVWDFFSLEIVTLWKQVNN